MEGEDLAASIGLLSDCEKVVPSEVVVDKDDETLVLVFDEALGVGDVFCEKVSLLIIYQQNCHPEHPPCLNLCRPLSGNTVKNRRRAFMDKLMYGGKFFFEDSIRDREPYLHHEFVGKFQDQSGMRMSRPGEKWPETLFRRAEEALLMEKIWMEQQRLGVDEMDWVGNEKQE
nr:hypothetical protein [Tanacetum cinerariifolium]